MVHKTYSEEQYVLVCNLCIAQLADRFMYEKNLFRSQASMTDVRAVKVTLLADGNPQRIKSEQDSAIIVGVLQCCLKEMPFSLFHEVYEDAVRVDMNDTMEEVRSAISSWITSIPTARFELLKNLVLWLSRVLAVSGSQESQSQFIANFISPFICRPSGSAFLSIRHQSDLKRIRPVVSCIIDSPLAIFTKDLKSKYVAPPPSTVKGSLVDAAKSSTAKAGSIMARRAPGVRAPRLLDLGIETASSDSATEDSDSSAGTSSREFGSLVDCVLVPAGSPEGEIGSLSRSGRDYPPVNVASWEWNLIGALALNRMELFLRPRESGTAFVHRAVAPTAASSFNKSSDLDVSDADIWDHLEGKDDGPDNLDLSVDVTSSSSSKKWARGAGGGGGGGAAGGDRDRRKSASRELVSQSMDSPSLSLASEFNTEVQSSKPSRSSAGSLSGQWSEGGSTSSVAARIVRRKMVAEVKALRQEITKFEDEWMKKHHKAPKASERGVMNEVYERYRSLKRCVRDSAAKSIQRLIRGFLARRRVRRSKSSLRPSNVSVSPSFNSNFGNLKVTPQSSTPNLSVSLDSALPGKRKNESYSGGSAGGSFAAGSSQGSSAFSGDGGHGDKETSKIPAGVVGKYRDLWSQKHELKRRLKKYDDDFAAQHHRQPTKSEKEIMRPMYDKYHEVKAALENLRVEIEATHGSLPDDLVNMTSGTKRVVGSDGGDSDMGGIGSEDEGAEQRQRSTNGAWTNPTRPALSADESVKLQEEKKKLHAYLKEYEREFTRLHGRPVMRPEDIQPVAQEYRRYKDLKVLLPGKK